MQPATRLVPEQSRTPLWLALATIALSAGCSGESGPICYPVRGAVSRGGQPLAEAMIVFHTLTPQSQPFPKPVGFADEQGRFQLMTFVNGDGAPAGAYRITVELRAPRQVGEEFVRDGPNTLPPRYSRPETSGLQFEVIAGDNEVPPLAIDGKQRAQAAR